MKETFTIAAAVFAAAPGIGVWAQAPAPRLLPLDNLGVEHLDFRDSNGITVELRTNAAGMRADLLRQYPSPGLEFTVNDRVATNFPAQPAAAGSR